MKLFRWWKERKQRRQAIRYIREGNAEIVRVFRELEAVIVEAAHMAQTNRERGGPDMTKEDIQQLVEEICSLRLQSAEQSDREDYSVSRSLDEDGDAAERVLTRAGYELEDDPGDIEIIHVLYKETRYASFHTGDWQWLESES